ncbi:bifunctional GNAT family N-acetyltransferase/acetate--CoA ligase family protein [Dietzia sp. ANT_WB102]|uniref:bifunctional acetate--CoA ligase family protein/GNAT family N-acetyltransferase n=1 Tax=Dietzia sp. ANT_WB102 TaxID=2597345 RepID=UPI0011EE1671|nr:bifunctional GNAT family N-acetyltransferase/acetate--CoA ligase family protein [Dietzia sp. ANT_WB102]KAA0919782.1 GNAT family N-acetyltransferase [Dietzia sp. ANT_WB102]
MAHPGDRANGDTATETPTDSTPAVDPPEHASTDTSVEEYPAGYPHEWAADVLGSDGRAVRVRPILPNDAEKISRFHISLSDRTRYLRYFGSHDVLSERELDRMTNVDYRDRMAFVAELGAEVIGMAIYERLPNSTFAEVAFTISDQHQGRGLGSIFLEHLAGAAAECGIDHFEAEVLSENRSMIQVFRRAGYEISRSFDGSTLHLEFAIDPTEALTNVRNSREAAAEARSLARVLNPGSVAVIGASDQVGKIGHTVLRNLIGSGFSGPVYPVNSDARSVQSVRAYASVRDIPDPVDLAVVAVPAASMSEVLDDCLSKGVSTLVVISAGFSDVGSAGVVSERRLVSEARAHGMRVVGPNALGVINTSADVQLNATLAEFVPGPGRTGFFCQSGALGIAILAAAARRGLGLSTFVSAGNRADVSGNDLLQYWDTDTATEVVLLYLESFGNPRKFSRIARRVARNKPVVVVRRAVDDLESGVEGLTANAIGGLFRDSGLIQVDSITDMFDTATLLAYQPLPAGGRLGIVGNSSAVGRLGGDAARQQGFTVAHSVDLGASASPDEFRDAITDVLKRDEVDSVLTVFVPPVATEPDAYAEAIRAAAGESTKPVVSTFLAGEGLPEGLTVTDESGVAARGSIPSYPYPERAVSALVRARRYAEWLDKPAEEPAKYEDIDRARARELVDSLCQLHAGTESFELTQGQVRALLECYGIDIVDYRVVTDVEQAVMAADELGYPVAVKAMSDRWRTRSDQSGVRLDLVDSAAVRHAFAFLQSTTGSRALHVQKMATKGVAVTIRVADHPIFGSLISFGLAGMLSDLLADRAFSTLPISPGEAAALLDRPRAAAILDGYAGDAAVDRGALVELMGRVSCLVDDIPEMRRLSVDPALAEPDGLAVLYATVRLGPPPRFSGDEGPRRLR